MREIPNLQEIWSYINSYMLYGRHLGFKGNFDKLLAERDPKALELFQDVEKVKEEAAKFMKIRAVWRFFEAERDGNSMHLFEPGEKYPLHTFRFGRQPKSDGLCLSDYVLDAEEGKRDHLAMFVVTRGRMRAAAFGRSEAAGRISAGTRAAGAGDRDGGRLRGMAAPPHPRGLGLSRSADHDHAGAVHVPLSRQAI